MGKNLPRGFTCVFVQCCDVKILIYLLETTEINNDEKATRNYLDI